MAVTQTGTGGLWTRLGKIFATIIDINRHLGNGNAAGTGNGIGYDLAQLPAQYASAQQSVLDGIWQRIATAQTSGDLGSVKSYLIQLAKDTMVKQVDDDAVLVSRDPDTAITEEIRQMAGTGTMFAAQWDVNAPTVEAAAYPFTINTGNGVVIACTKRIDGRNAEYIFNETVEVTVQLDAGTGGTARQEPMLIKGEAASNDRLAWDAPDGSGASGSLTVSDAALNAQTGNLLYNGNMDTFTVANQPDYWGSAVAGVYGTDIFSEGTTVYRAGGKSLKLTGTGSAANPSIAQAFGVASPATGTSGTSQSLKPNTIYGFNMFIADSGASLAAGVVQIALVDGTNTVITNDAGGSCSCSFDYRATTTSFQPFCSSSKTLVYTFAATWEADDEVDVSLTVAGITDTVTLTGSLGTTGTTAAAALVTAWNALTQAAHPLFKGIVASSVAGLFILRSNGPFTCSLTPFDVGHSTATGQTIDGGTTAAAGTSVAAGAFFITPKVLPSTVKFKITATTDLTSGQSIYIDDICFVEMKLLYTGGPLLAAFAGSTNFAKDDKFNVVVSNNYAGVIQDYTDRIFDLKRLGLQLPSDAAAGETVADTLVDF